MNSNKMSCFYHPTNVIIVDDDPDFLRNLPGNLDPDLQYRLFETPFDALHFIEAERNKFPTPQDFVGSKTHMLDNGKILNVDISRIHHTLYNKKRFSIPSVAIVDNDMPGMKGVEFCRQLKDSPLKKIMLTGTSDRNLAIQAFNDGVIHKFISKSDPNIFDALKKAVHVLQQDYFNALSALVIKNITTTTDSYLENTAFIKFFSDFLQKNNVTEFYLTDSVGSFLVVNAAGELMWLVLQSEEAIQHYCDMAEEHDASASLMRVLTNREKLLCLFSQEDYEQPIEKWVDYIYPAQKIPGLEQGYYALIKGNEAYIKTGIKKEDIFS